MNGRRRSAIGTPLTERLPVGRGAVPRVWGLIRPCGVPSHCRGPAGASACRAPRGRRSPPTPAPTPAQRLASADALVRAGCLDCLIAAYGEYDLLRTFPAATRRRDGRRGPQRGARRAPRARAGAGGRRLRPARARPADWRAKPAELAADAARHHRRAARVRRRHHAHADERHRARSRPGAPGQSCRLAHRLRELAPIDELAAYVWLAFTCGATESRDLTLDELVEPASTFKTRRSSASSARSAAASSPSRFSACANATRVSSKCRTTWDCSPWASGSSTRRTAIRGSLRVADAVAEPDAVDRHRRDDRGRVRALAEFYNRTLELEPHAVDAMLGKVRALTYLGRNPRRSRRPTS